MRSVPHILPRSHSICYFSEYSDSHPFILPLLQWDSLGLKTFFPLCCGHEVVGTVIEAGKDAQLKVGDRVGCGPQRNSNCYRNKLPELCVNCQNGEEQLCVHGVEGLYNPKTGGFGSQVRVPWRFAFKLPEEIPSHVAGPLLCAGVTVFSPIVHADLRPGAKVAVVGIGGLGHMALMYAKAMGYEVTAVTRSLDKVEQIKQYGATQIINSSDKEDMEKHQGTFDFVLNTVSAPIAADQYLRLLKARGKLTYVGLGCDNIQVNPFSLVSGCKNISGSYIGGRKDMEDMLAFSAKHKIFPTCEVVEAPFGTNSAEKVTAAVAKVINNSARFRMVLDYKKQ